MPVNTLWPRKCIIGSILRFYSDVSTNTLTHRYDIYKLLSRFVVNSFSTSVYQQLFHLQIQQRHAQEVKVDDLQKTLLQMKFVNGKRELVHQQIRSKLQEEIRSLKEQKVRAVYNKTWLSPLETVYLLRGVVAQWLERRFKTWARSFTPHCLRLSDETLIHRWSLLSGVYARARKGSHTATGAECVTCLGTQVRILFAGVSIIGIFVLSTMPQLTQLYKWVSGCRQEWKCEWLVFVQRLRHGWKLLREVHLVSDWKEVCRGVKCKALWAIQRTRYSDKLEHILTF